MKFECLNDLFSQYLFTVPDYQRGYAWGLHEVDEFWGDLQNIEPNAYHFAGTLILKDLGPAESGKLSVEVVDGQQRLATSVILLRALRDRITALGLDHKEAFRDIGKTYLWCNENGTSVYPFAYAEGSEARIFFAGQVCGDTL